MAIDERKGFYPDYFEIEIHSSAERTRQVRVVQIPLYDDDRPIWLEYPRLEEMYVDIIAINLQNYCQDGDYPYFWDKNDYPSQSQIISQGPLIRVIGYPLGFQDYIHKLPIARHATIASPYTVAFENQPYFLIDASMLDVIFRPLAI